ncbi:hypothetical protein [Aerococcus urinae]|uniref:hypothetical protein n=1 Tax=Aerococcus urinae TaxID=1376 RepID=UPI00254CF4C1|nr:hypothetical protein [Aerococcus urinae]MDK7716057.1 hypothetical protein [Aerococcus urinae]
MKPWIKFRERHGTAIEYEENGYPCLIRINDFDILCGYVAIPISHPLYLYNLSTENLEVHGGITYEGFLKGDKNFWYIGFDCGHSWDFIPSFEKYRYSIASWLEPFECQWRDERYIRNEISYLIEQLEEMKDTKKPTSGN